MTDRLGGCAMRKILVGVGALCAFVATPVQAADPAAMGGMPPFAPHLAWTGFYVGGQIGGVWSRDELTEDTAFVPPSTGHATTHSSATVGGLYGGYNWQHGNLVFGPEIEFEGRTLDETSTCLVQDSGAGNVSPGSCFPNVQGYSFRTEIPWQGSLRGRIGVDWGNGLLAYASGGVAFADIKTTYSQSTGPAASQSFSQQRSGYTIGGGLELRFQPRWVGRLEYSYTDFGTVSTTATSAGAFWNGYTNRHAITQDAVRLGVSYLF